MSCGDDIRPSVYVITPRKARKAHRCDACKQECIRKGDYYTRTFGIWDGSSSTVKRCLRCEAIFNHLVSVSQGDLIDIRLDCGHDWEELHDDPPPDWLVGVVLSRPDELQALHALEQGLKKLTAS